MLFSLEAFQADHGDALLLHFGPPSNPKFILIDGGPTPNGYLNVIKPRLQSIREQFVAGDDPLVLEMVMLSHIDDDHIVGLQALMKHLKDSEDDQIPLPWQVRTLWFNSFDEILGNPDQEIFSELTAQVAAAGLDAPLPGAAAADPYGAAVIASVPNGRLLRQAAEGLGITRNDGFDGLVMAGHEQLHQVELSHGLKLTVISPDETRVQALHDKWEESLEQQPDIEELANLAANSDLSVANLSSIVVLAELGEKKMLLTGDGRSDHILEGLENAGLVAPGGIFPVDILKLPHHGSNRNVTKTFFKRVPAQHYVISANGKDDNPDLSTLEMIESGRPDANNFTIHLTNHFGQNDLAEILDEFFDARLARGRSYDVKYRNDDGSAALSLRVDLLDAVNL